MSRETIQRLEDLARADPAVAPLALLQAQASRACADPLWEKGVPPLDRRLLEEGRPLLHGQTLLVDAARVRDFLVLLAEAASRTGIEGGDPLRRAFESATIDSLSTLQAGITQDIEKLQAMASEAGVKPVPLVTLAELVALPLLQCCGRRAAPLLEGVSWDVGYCQLCGAWPTLAERRGLERQRWLRCGRCGSGWVFYQERCAYCGNVDHGTLGYLAPEGDMESRRAVICDRCHGFLKTLTTLGPLTAADIALKDLTTLELDVAALDRGYSRPEGLGFPMKVTVAPAEWRDG